MTYEDSWNLYIQSYFGGYSNAESKAILFGDL